MNEDQDTILNDKRPIQSVWLRDDEGTRFVASDRVTIGAYPEPGERCYIPWIRVKIDGKIEHRLSAHGTQIVYRLSGEVSAGE